MPTYDFFRDPIMQFWALIATVVIGAVTIVLMVAIYFLQKNRKELSYEVLSSTPLVTVAQQYGSRIQVLWDGEPIPDVSLVVLWLGSTGNKEICAEEFDGNIDVTFPGAERVLSADVNETTPANLHSIPITDGKLVSIPPLLLNSGDSMTLSFFVAGYEGQTNVAGRAAGMPKIKLKTSVQQQAIRTLVVTLIVAIFFLCIVFFIGPYLDPDGSSTVMTISITIIAAALGFLTWDSLQRIIQTFDKGPPTRRESS